MDNEHVISQLQAYSACDISDALLKLKVPTGGIIADLLPVTDSARPPQASSTAATPVVVAPLSTILFAPKDPSLQASMMTTPKTIPADANWADLTQPGTVVLMKQPAGQTNAVCGGIMALRIKVRGAKGILVAGRVRDVEELEGTGLPIWARGLSTVGVGAASVPWAAQVDLEFDGTVARPGDLAFCDPVNGIVVIPQDKVSQVLDWLPRLTSADDKVKQDVAQGVSVFEAFKRHRGNL